MKNNQYCVIMAGGTGSQFWPLSRENRPKQFIDMGHTGLSCLRSTYDRFTRIVPGENILVVTLDRFRGQVQALIPELPEDNLLLEPYARNTAPCLAFAMYTLLRRNPDAVMAATPSDLLIDDEELFAATVRNALDYAAAHPVLMTLGIAPTGPDTHFGYIQVQGGKSAATSGKPLKVKTFTEKPDRALAEVFCRSGEFFWNSGIFVWRADTLRTEMERHLPEITRLFEGWENALGSSAERLFIEQAYTDSPNVSVDIGVMEKTDIAWLYPATFGWTDISSWDMLWRENRDKDADGNVFLTDRHFAENTSGSLVVSGDRGRLIALKGLKDYLVVDTPDALLICPRDDKSFRELITGLGMPGYEDFR